MWRLPSSSSSSPSLWWRWGSILSDCLSLTMISRPAEEVQPYLSAPSGDTKPSPPWVPTRSARRLCWGSPSPSQRRLLWTTSESTAWHLESSGIKRWSRYLSDFYNKTWMFAKPCLVMVNFVMLMANMIKSLALVQDKVCRSSNWEWRHRGESYWNSSAWKVGCVSPQTYLLWILTADLVDHLRWAAPSVSSCRRRRVTSPGRRSLWRGECTQSCD